jgi:hypothetical protein
MEERRMVVQPTMKKGKLVEEDDSEEDSNQSDSSSLDAWM